IDPGRAKVILIEAGPRLLSAFPATLSLYAQRTLERLGVIVLTNTSVQDINADGVQIEGEFIPAGTIILGAGTLSSPAGKWLGLEDQAGRIPVDGELKIPGHPGVYALGDTALCI